jgi:hypothetical protein
MTDSIYKHKQVNNTYKHTYKHTYRHTYRWKMCVSSKKLALEN